MHGILLLENIKELLPCSAGAVTPLCGPALRNLECIADGAVAVRDGRILAVGTREAVRRELPAQEALQILDCGGGVVLPGFVDSHSHAVFHRTREEEFSLRVAGAKYLEILAAGGGILSSVRSLKEISLAQLVEISIPRLEAIFAHGTTTLEVKSGYGLAPAEERKMLEAVRELNRRLPIDLVPTYCAAHALPPEWTQDPDAFLDLCLEQIPSLVADGLACFNDIFIEEGVFTVAQGRRYLRRGMELGLPAKFHADEIHPLGGAELAAELRAVSADHLLAASDEGLRAMAAAGVIATWLPGTLYSLMGGRYPDYARVEATGVPMALASDFNPGSNFAFNMQTVISQASILMRAPVAAAIQMATVNGAHALALGADRGSILPGRRADLIVLDAPSHLYLAYHYGSNLVRTVIKNGKVYQIPRFRLERTPV